MPKTEDEKIKDKFDSLQRARDTAAGRLGKNGAGAKDDASEAKYALACKEFLQFGNANGLSNKMPLKKKYLRGL